MMKTQTQLILVCMLTFPFLMNAQVNVSTLPGLRNAVLEVWNGLNCGYCPLGDIEVQTAMDNNPGRVSVINIHSGGFAVPNALYPNSLDFRTTQGDVHFAAFSPTGVPESTLNRRIIGGLQKYHPATVNDLDKIPDVLDDTAEVNIYATATLDVNTRILDVSVEYYYTSSAPSLTNFLYVGVNQNNLEGYQASFSNPINQYNPNAWSYYPVYGPLYNHQHVFRQFMTEQWGDSIKTTLFGSTGVMIYSDTLALNIAGTIMDLGNIEVVIFINDGYETVGNILNGVSIIPTLTGIPSSDEIVFLEADISETQGCQLGAPVTADVDVKVFNAGSNPISSATISYDINGGSPQFYNFNNASYPIMPYTSRIIPLDPISWTTAATNDLNIELMDPNGVPDYLPDNLGTLLNVVTAANNTEILVNVNIHTDTHADDIWMEITNSSGTIVWSEGNENVQGNYDTGIYPAPVDFTNPLGNDQSYSWDVWLPEIDCYTFTIYDYFGDGWTDGGSGVGYNVKDNLGTTLFTQSFLSFGGMDVGGLIKNNLVEIDELAISDLTIYPNPARDVINVNFTANSENINVSLIDLQGRILQSISGLNDVEFQTTHLASGSYLVRVISDDKVISENIIIQ